MSNPADFQNFTTLPMSCKTRAFSLDDPGTLSGGLPVNHPKATTQKQCRHRSNIVHKLSTGISPKKGVIS